MIERFRGKRDVLVDALREQKLVRGDVALAARIADTGELVEVPRGATVMSEGDAGCDVYLILAGSFAILVHGRVIARSGVGDHVGEMAVTLPSQACSATVRATELSVVVRVTQAQFMELATAHPEVWRTIARDLSIRLEERNAIVPKMHDKIRLFVISLSESLSVARAVQNAFEHDPFHVTVWSDGVFVASHYPVEALEKQLDESDFAIAIASPDDMVESRGKSVATARDNVIFEFGLFIGRLGRRRSILLEPHGESIRLPSDLGGITTISYKHGPTDDLATAIGPAVNKIREIVNDLGPS